MTTRMAERITEDRHVASSFIEVDELLLSQMKSNWQSMMMYESR